MADIIGTNGNDSLFGSEQDDMIDGLAGEDFFLGSAGSDLIDGGAGGNVLQFQQADFVAGRSRFWVSIDDYTLVGGKVQAVNGGAGRIALDADGDGVADAGQLTQFAHIGAVRLVSGIGSASAGDGQGEDTLDLAQLSLDAGGISYDLTDRGRVGEAAGSPASVLAGQSAGDVRFSADAHASANRPVEADFESLFLQVDGAEHLLGGAGNDLLFIDESEAAKNNRFSAGAGIDRVEYQNFYGATERAAEPTLTIKVNSLGAGSHEVRMSGGRVGAGIATDSLIDVELITLLAGSHTATSPEGADTIDVGAMSGQVTIDYRSGEIRDAAGTVQLTIENITEIERVVDGAVSAQAAMASSVSGTLVDGGTSAPDSHEFDLGLIGIDPGAWGAELALFPAF